MSTSKGTSPGSAADASRPDVRWGDEEPPEPRRIVVGLLEFGLAGAAVENVRFHGVEVLRSLEVVVRDRNWGTVPAQVTRCEVSGHPGRCAAHLEVQHVSEEIGFAWTGDVVAEPDRLTASFEGEALRDFQRNRIGWCLLHPLRLGGVSVEVETPAGDRSSGAFPEWISPHQPLRDIRAMRYAGHGIGVTIAFEGEVFETEDQRNWTDASYKTYGTPLALPFPVTVRRGERISQQVTIGLSNRAGSSTAATATVSPVPGTVDPGRPGDGMAVRPGEPGAGPADGVDLVKPGGLSGPLPPIGLAVPGDRELRPGERACLGAVRPAFLHAELPAADARWPERLSAAAAEASRLGIPLHVEAVADEPEEMAALAAAALAERPPVTEFYPYHEATHVTTAALAESAAGVLRGTGIRLGGGTRAHFAELNRAGDLPLPLLDVVSYTIAAEMHDTSRAGVRETLLAQPDTVTCARRIAEGRPVAVGPVGFKPRFNAVATSAPVQAPAGALPGSVDPRQASVFGAAWTVGTLAALAGADALLLYDAAGRRGIAEADDAEPHPSFPAAPGAPYPLWAVLAALGPLAGGWVRRTGSPPGMPALAVQSGRDGLLLLANLRDITARCVVTLPDELAGGQWWLLAADRRSRRGWSLREWQPAGPRSQLELPAPAVAMLSTRPVKADP
jgi:D-apionolactonase